MSPQALLIQTEKAAGDPNLHEWHTTLVEMGNQLDKHLTVGLRVLAA